MYRALLLSALLLLPRVALSVSNEPSGFGKATFGASIAQVKAVLPQVTRASTEAPGTSETAFLAIYELKGQTLYGLKPCLVGFRFASDRLYEVTFDCGRSDAVVSALQKQFGDPTKVGPDGVFWQGEKTVISMNPQARTFSFADRRLSQDVQASLLRFVLTQGKPPEGQEPTPPTPAATPQ